MTSTVAITGLYIYPVKSMQGCALTTSQLREGGLVGDRQWAVFKADGRMLSQREEPKMALIKASPAAAGLQLSTASGDAMLINEGDVSAEEESFPMWKDLCFGSRAPREVGKWLEELLESKTALDLVMIRAQRPRIFHQPERFKVSANYFSDAAPLLVCNEASLTALNAALLEQGRASIDHRHFRPNIVVSGIDAFAEHHFRSLAIVPVKASDNAKSPQPIIELVDHCQRCSIITVNPDTGQPLENAYPLTSLMRLNTMPEGSQAPAYGVNARCAAEGVNIELSLGQTLAIQ